MFTAGPSKPDHARGWEMAADATEEFEAPDDWQAGRIWWVLHFQASVPFTHPVPLGDEPIVIFLSLPFKLAHLETAMEVWSVLSRYPAH